MIEALRSLAIKASNARHLVRLELMSLGLRIEGRAQSRAGERLAVARYVSWEELEVSGIAAKQLEYVVEALDQALASASVDATQAQLQGAAAYLPSW